MKVRNIVAPLFALAVLAGCNGGSNAATAAPEASLTGNTPGTNKSAGPSSSGNQNVAVGESCQTGDAEHLCLAVKFVTYQDSAGKAVASQAQAATIISTMNKLFAQCNIGFQVETYEAVDPTQAGLSYGSQSQSETNEIRKTYMESNQLLSVTTGPWGTAVNAWTSMPGEGVYGAIHEASIVDYNGGIIYAHEFGHYLGLDHTGSTANLMSAVIYGTSTELTASQCQAARETASSYWAAMVR